MGTNVLTLRTVDGEEVTLPVELASQSVLLSEIIDLQLSQAPILVLVTARVLNEVIRFWRNCRREPESIARYVLPSDYLGQLTKWERDQLYRPRSEWPRLKALMEAGNYFNSPRLVRATLLVLSAWIVESSPVGQ